MLLDFMFKKSIFNIAYAMFYVNNIVFSEKYFVEYMFFRFNKFCDNLYIYFDYFSNEFTYVVLAFAMLSLVGFILFCLLNG